MILFPHCKINLGLSIENKRPDGFHNIKTILYPIDLMDVLEINTSDESQISMTMSGIPIQGNIQSNLCVRAYELINKDFHLPAVNIHLHKAIPHGAGLGGGSSDAAFTIKMLNSKFNLGLSNEQMKLYASELGSDCAFFIENKAVVAKGKGDIFEKTDISLQNYYILIVKPDVCVNTSEAYQWIKPQNAEIDIESILKLPIESWKEWLVNDFEESVFKKYPVIRSIKELFYKSGAVYAAMSGSGAAVYGIFQEPPTLPSFSESYFRWGNFIK